nr:putative disease resistance protein RGA4 isoform X2 [Quercus suber]
MAEGALFDVAKGITEKVGSLVAQEIGLLWSLKDEIEKLNGTVSTISAVLQDAEEKQQHNEQVSVWLGRLSNALYEADDLLDDISTEALRREVMTRNKKAKEVRIFFSKSNKLAYGLKMGHKVKAMRQRLDFIKNDRGFHLDELPAVEAQVRETHSFVRTEDVIGRDNDKVEIIRILLDPNVEESVLILPIIGLGGLGKTTLAQLVFNDREIQNHFEQKLWACVSDDFEVKVIVKKILECAQNKKQEEIELNTLINNLKKEIDGKRYLLVLDDVWNEDPQKWLELKSLLMDGARGSRILVTTRINKVADITKTIQPYMLEGLDKEKSWSLFKLFAFANEQDSLNSNIRKIGMEIIAKCKGNPLAIRSLGSLLHFKNPRIEWLSFKDNELSEIPQEGNDILPTLKLSYNHLPSYLKQCFAYCCLFPKDYKIYKTKLIKMWMAQGFIRSSSPNKCLEDIGHEYFMDLLWRSFFQEVEEDDRGNILLFKMHDLMHDLAKSIVAFDSVTFYSKGEDIHEKARHVSFDRTFLSSSEIPISFYRASRIRTFYLPGLGTFGDLNESNCNAIISSFKFIRLLDLSSMGIKTIPSSIGNLKHLRYLDVSYNHIKMLPSSITSLHNLQTLVFFGYGIKALPKDISKLVNLTYIDGTYDFDFDHMPRGLGQLTKLQTLSQFVMSQNSCLDFRRHGGLKELNGLNKLRGTLEIKGLRHGKEAASESKDSNMKEKIHLQDLTLSWIEEDVDESNVGYDEESLEALLPHGPLSNLQQLSLNRYGGVNIPSGISLLSNLVNLSLDGCNKCQHLPPLDQFHSLKTLSLEHMNDLEYISERENNGEFSDSSFLPSLEQLTIKFCPNLKGWWQRQRDSVEEFHNHSLPSFPHLSNLLIRYCRKLISLPLFPYLEKLELANCSLKPLEQTLRMEVIKTATPKNLTSIAATSTSSSSTLAASSFIPLSKLKSMSIWHMEETLPKELKCNLISLQDLKIGNCCGPLPLSRHLTALQNLRVIGSKEVDLTNDGDEMEWHGLQSLRLLRFSYLPNLATLPVGIQHLSSLQTLEIVQCPILSKRCEREAGEDWSKIAHIPNLDIS